MFENAYSIAKLIEKSLKETLSEEELDVLQNWAAASPDNQRLLNQLNDKTWVSGEIKLLASYKNKLQNRIYTPKRPNNSYKIRRYGIAASVIVLLSLVFYFIRIAGGRSEPVKLEVKDRESISAPQFTHATITLADGSIVSLDSAVSGQVALQAGINLVKLNNGQIAYRVKNGAVLQKPPYNTIHNPRGSKVVTMQLSDGTQVWLNAGSTLTFPVAFTGTTRSVTLIGEGYFEVAKDVTKKFLVNAGGLVTEVLGTRFNINMNNERGQRVTLIEGSVKISSQLANNTHQGKSEILKPGQQATLEGSHIQINKSPNIDQILSWKNGYFNFDDMSLRDVMQELERWYAIDVKYQSSIPDLTFGGEINRNADLKDVLSILKKSGIQFNWDASKKQLMVL